MLPALRRAIRLALEPKYRLGLYALLVVLISFLLWRDRALNENFRVSIIPPDADSFVIPGYMMQCKTLPSLTCTTKVEDHILTVQDLDRSQCQATYGQQRSKELEKQRGQEREQQGLTCEKITASAEHLVMIRGVNLSILQVELIKFKIGLRSLGSPRILKEGAHNGVLLQFLLFILSAVTGKNLAQSLYSWCQKHLPRWPMGAQVFIAVTSGLGGFAILLVYFMALLMRFGYVG
jgi:hypothetical protein